VTEPAVFLGRVRRRLESIERTALELPSDWAVEIEDPLRRFESEVHVAGGTFHYATEAEAGEVLQSILVPLGKPLVLLTHESGIPATVASSARVAGRLEWWPTTREVAVQADVGVTGALWGVAETGTVLVSSASPGGRAPSLLPPIHVAFVARSRLLNTVAELFKRIAEMKERPSNLVLVTGPSKSGDIENVLVRRVHGPGETHVVMLEDG
jgi:L-lactate utilization protein LutC